MSSLMLRLFPTEVFHVLGYHDEVALAAPERGRLLDLGCGDNGALATFRTPDREVWGTDFQAHSALQHPEWFRTLPPDGTLPFPDGHFDAVAARMVLEHVSQPRQFLREVARVLKPGGHFVGHTVSGSHYVTWLRRLFGLLPHALNQLVVRGLYGRACEDTFVAHYRLNGEGQIARACRGTGLVPVRLRRYADPGYFQFWPWLRDLAIRVDHALEKVAPGWGRLYLTTVLKKQ